MIEEEEKKKRAKMGLGGVPPDDEPNDIKKKFEALKRKYLMPHIDQIFEKAKRACENLGKPELMKKYDQKEITVTKFGIDHTYEVTKMKHIEWDVVKDSELLPEDYAVTQTSIHKRYDNSILENVGILKKEGYEARCRILMKESRVENLSEALPDGYHENYHTKNKLDQGISGNSVEGANEIMSYEDSINTLSRMQNEEVEKINSSGISTEDKEMMISEANEKYHSLKEDVCMAEGQYRDTAAAQYLLREIIGEDNYNAGHLVAGEVHLRETFDNVAGEGRYDEIFASEKNPVTGEWVDKVGDAEKITALQDVFEKKVATNLQHLDFVRDNVDNIRDYGKYKMKGE